MIVFLDVDGTYADRGSVPAAHADAVRAARARGHSVLLCTGRPKSLLPSPIVAAGFDGFVAGAGLYVEVHGRVLRDQRFPAGLAERTVAVLDSHDVAYLLETPDELLGPEGIDARLTDLLARRPTWVDAGGERVMFDIVDRVRTRSDLRGARFGKVTVFDSPVAVSHLGALLGPEVATLPSSIPELGSVATSGEIYLAHVHKAIGAEIATRELGAGREDVVAVGDGLNDLELLAWAGTGIAIEGSDPQVLAVADRAIPGPGQQGLTQLFDELGLTGP